jgi:Thioredoxin-like
MRHPLSILLLAGSLLGQEAPVPNPTELGSIVWQRDLDAGLAQANKTGKPAFLLFQEIPGCDTCTSFGKDVLGHPLLAAAIEHSFVPIAIRNNVDGKEGEVRERFQEPAWNNPVVRLLDAAGKDLLPRRDGIFDAHGIAARMIDALAAGKQPVPGYLRIALAESDPKTTKAVFGMHCFWQGEAVLGALDGVVRTHAAFVDGAEVVEVTYRPAVLSAAKLTEQAQSHSCQPITATALRAAPASDQQHALLGTPYGKLDLSPMQRTKVHAALKLGTDPKVWLSPKQLAALPPAAAPRK